MKIRDLSSAMDNSQTSDLTFLATREVVSRGLNNLITACNSTYYLCLVAVSFFFWGGGGKLIADPDSWLDRFIVDDFQLVNFQQKQFVVYSFAPEV
jgi:hypothetical protein